MRKVLLYIHGKGGSSKEIEQLKPFCNGYEIHGIDLADFTPWGTEEQIQNAFESLKMGNMTAFLLLAIVSALISLCLPCKTVQSKKHSLFCQYWIWKGSSLT